MQGVLTDGLSMTLHAGLHIDNGAVREGSYSDYRFARMADSPLDDRRRRDAADAASPAARASSASRPRPRAVANAYARATGTTPFSFPIAG